MGAENLLLKALPREVRERLLRHGRTVQLAHAEVLHRPNQTIDDVYFPLDCMISVTVTLEEGQTVEAGAAGRREMVGVNAFMGGRETNQTESICQIAGTAVTIPSQPLLQEFDGVKGVRDVLLRFVQAYVAQLSQNVACNRVHSLEQRLARWLLECHDRLGSDALEVSHQFVAQMLGVRRAGISEAAAVLQQHGLIESSRMHLRILDSEGLGRVSCECFRVLRDEYDRLLEPMIKS